MDLLSVSVQLHKTSFSLEQLLKLISDAPVSNSKNALLSSVLSPDQNCRSLATPLFPRIVTAGPALLVSIPTPSVERVRSPNFSRNFRDIRRRRSRNISKCASCGRWLDLNSVFWTIGLVNNSGACVETVNQWRKDQVGARENEKWRRCLE